MPKQIPRELIVKKNRQNSAAAYIMLLDVTLNNVQNTKFHFARNYEDIVFQGPLESSDDCVGYWKLDDNLGTTDVIDSCSNSNDGVSARNTSLLSVAATVDEGFDMVEASSDEVIVPSHNSYNFEGAFSIGIWADPNTVLPGHTEHILGRALQSGASGYSLSKLTNGKWIFRLDIDSSQAQVVSNDAASGSSQLIVVTRDNSGSMLLYIDSVLQSSSAVHDGAVSNTLPLLIGSHSFLDIGTKRFDGVLDNMFMMNRDLSQSEVTAQYNSGSGTDKVGTVYQKANFEIDPIVDDNSGEITSVQLRVSDVGQLLQPYLKEIDGAIGSTIRITVVNSEELDSDYSTIQEDWDILGTTVEFNAITFTIGKPSPLRQRFPLYRYIAQHCRWTYVRQLDGNSAEVECDYIGETVIAVTLPSAAPVIIEVTGHPWVDTDFVRLESIGGITPSLADSYQVTKTGANTFTLDGTDGDDFSGAYTSGGLAGYHTCKRTLADCRLRGREVVYGGHVGMRSRGIHVAR